MEFIKDDGYKRPEFWFSDGWDYINHNKISNPYTGLIIIIDIALEELKKSNLINQSHI